MENTSDFFSINLKRLRKSLDMTQLDLAEIVGVSALTIQRYESGDRFPRQNILKALAQALKTTESSLLDNPNNTKTHDDDYNALMKKIDSIQVITSDEIAAIVAQKIAESRQPVSKQDTKNMSEKDKLILQITSSLPLLNVNNLTGISNSINRLISKGRIKKSVNS